MNKIEVELLSVENLVFERAKIALAAQITQRGHKIRTMSNMKDQLDIAMAHANTKDSKLYRKLSLLPHKSIRYHTFITVAIVGASRRFLQQARTHHVGLSFTSGSLQYSDYSDTSDMFVVPYEILEERSLLLEYTLECNKQLELYKNAIKGGISNDTAGYLLPESTRNILLMSGTLEAFSNFINVRSCNRNTDETQYVALRILQEINKTVLDEAFISGPNCMLKGSCEELESMQCGYFIEEDNIDDFMKNKWPLLYEEV